MEKTAIVLFNLGGPDAENAVKPFLFNLFNDPAIIRLPSPLRYIIAKLISGRREKKAQGIYAQMGGRSPILENTKAQAKALEEVFSKEEEIKCFIAMRYWHPFIDEALLDVKNYAPDRVVLLPLYPQFSTTTTGSSLKAWKKAAKKMGFDVPTKAICCYPSNSGFIDALAGAITEAYSQGKNYGTPRILFSAHGLPEKIVKAGDPYQFQCERTAESLVKKLGITKLDWVLCYQSRVGPLKWIGPSTELEIERAGKDKVPILVVPIAFVSEHSETIVEIDIDYRALAKKMGVPHYIYVRTVGVTPLYILGLKNLVLKAFENPSEIMSEGGKRLCPKEFCGCYQSPFSSSFDQ